MPSPNTIKDFFRAEQALSDNLTTFRALNGKNFERIPSFLNDFNEIVSRLEVIKNSINNIDDLRLSSITQNYHEYNQRLREIIGNDYQNSLPNDKFNALNRVFKEFLDYLNSTWELLFKPTDADILRNEIEQLKKQGEADAKSISDLKHQMEIELKEFDERYKKNLGDYELLSQEKIFRDVALSDHYEGKKWIWYIAGLTIILLGLSIWFMYSCWLDFACLFSKKSIGNFNNTEEWQVLFYYELFKPVAIRVFILSVIILLLKFALKNYNSLMHNKIVNMHKANSLAAMIRVINSLSDENTRTTLINLAGKEIFLHQKTGYLRKDDNKIDLGIIEKLASILQKKE